MKRPPRHKRKKWRWKHVPTGLYWRVKRLRGKGLHKVWSNLDRIGTTLRGNPPFRAIVVYYNPDDAYNYKVSSPVRVSKPGEWVLEEKIDQK